MSKKTPISLDSTSDEALQTMSYEAALAELDAIVRQMESAQLPLDQLLTHYQRGATLLQLCQEKLKALENQVSLLDNGQLKPWRSTR